MKEVEIKVRNIDKEEIIKKIKDLGAVKIFTGRIIDYRYDTPQRDLSKQGKALRIRQKGKYIFLNVKGKKKSEENITDRDELGLRVTNIKIMQKMLQELGYIKIFELHKYRTEYRTDDATFDIDEYVGMDPILEIESQDKKTVEHYRKKLEIAPKDVGRVYIREILAAKKNWEEQRRAAREEYSKTRAKEKEDEDNKRKKEKED